MNEDLVREFRLHCTRCKDCQYRIEMVYWTTYACPEATEYPRRWSFANSETPAYRLAIVQSDPKGLFWPDCDVQYI